MRLSFVLSLVVAIGYVVTCNATEYSDETNIAMVESPDLVRRSLRNGDIAGGRFLRAHEEDDAGERTFSVTDLWNKVAAKKLAKAMLADPSKEQKAYEKWAKKGYSLDKIKNWLAIADPKQKGKYDRIYNGYTFHLYQS
ncbi:Avr1b-1 avirulence-like protein [Phytophthora sojae]|uniref:RxLR effector protein n=2 Tax=Phytophthora sojae TaxID=67593 RepID=G4ZRQ8_PHYSP|nr:Avr1b-1 avirulence-like protein [Phytophthora sojae]AAM20934.1 elicitor Avr1b [Phytophthora sojae]AAM20937.1 elicitor Avr1b [Phytophthora sojae]EGZ13867.1 Avr1b-1 avirulence-like protein [Phytophthora sojae]|eukprot:XP_009531296.1 Avr1b-1 avirulence-like protein [Phytophthora sojae]